VKLGIRHDFRYVVEGGAVCPRDEECVAASDDRRRDARDLFGCLPLAEDDFREPLADGAMMIHAGEAQVFHWLDEPLACAAFRVGRLELAKPNGFEQGTEGIDLHGHPFDSAETPSLEWWAVCGASRLIL
jgi:hypothetical protein